MKIADVFHYEAYGKWNLHIFENRHCLPSEIMQFNSCEELKIYCDLHEIKIKIIDYY